MPIDALTRTAQGKGWWKQGSPASTDQATPACSGTRAQGNASSYPNGVYSQTDIDVFGAKVDYIDVKFPPPQCQPPEECILPLDSPQTYDLDLKGCMIVGNMCIPFPGVLHETFTDGRFIPVGMNQGSMLIPRSGDPNNPINALLKIQWCPDQNYFLVKLAGKLLKPLRHHESVFSNLASSADPVQVGSQCSADPRILGQCGSTSIPPSGLECKCIVILVRGVPEPICSCQKQTSPYLNTKCDPKAYGTCGSTTNPSSGLTCKCEVFGADETCTCQD